jgi:hypothetical protein
MLTAPDHAAAAYPCGLQEEAVGSITVRLRSGDDEMHLEATEPPSLGHPITVDGRDWFPVEVTFTR